MSILEPIPTDWRWLDELAAAGPLDPGFVEAVKERPKGGRRSTQPDLSAL